MVNKVRLLRNSSPKWLMNRRSIIASSKKKLTTTRIDGDSDESVVITSSTTSENRHQQMEHGKWRCQQQRRPICPVMLATAWNSVVLTNFCCWGLHYYHPGALCTVCQVIHRLFQVWLGLALACCCCWLVLFDYASSASSSSYQLHDKTRDFMTYHLITCIPR